jgi:rod shape-determining protein MreC
MRSLLNFLARYNNLIIFLILEGVSVYFIATRNTYHNNRALFAIRSLTNGIEEKMSNTRNYLNLRDINKNLAAENVALKNRLERLVREENSLFFSVTDSVYKQQYVHSTAQVNKGKLQGVKVDMAVNSENGVAGVIVGCSNNFSIAMSLLNIDFKLSVRIKSNGYFGSLSWDGRDYRQAVLSEIPQHVPVSAGDTIETTGFSAVFPEGILVGTVNDFEKIGGDFYKIKISLVTDFKKMYFVDVIGNMKKSEQLDLQNLFQ